MVSPNLFLRLNISFNATVGLLLIYFNICKNNNLLTNIVGLIFLYISSNNIVILKQKSAPKLKKDILRTNSMLFSIIGLFILFNLRKIKKINRNNITLIILNLFALFINFIGYKITKA